MVKTKKNSPIKKVPLTNSANSSQKNTTENETFQYSMDDVIKAQEIAELAVIKSIKNMP